MRINITMLKTLTEYTKLEKSILNLITFEFFVQMINVSFIAILPLYMKKEGFSDAQYAHFTSYRYFGMLALAVFLGMYIKNKRIIPLFYIASVGIPLFALMILVGVNIHSNALLLVAHLLWGTAYTFIQIPILPFILRNAPKAQHTLAITLNFATWSIASISTGFIISLLNGINNTIFSERNLLFAIVIIGFTGIYFVLRINKNEYVPAGEKKHNTLKHYDWKLIRRASIPILILATGAGFTIPFMSLFFSTVHNMTTSAFSFITFLTAIIVTIVAMYVPKIKNRYGYLAIPTTQSFAIIALIIVATTQYYSHWHFAIYIAAGFYILRQPLMSTAVPMTSEMTMKYVGERNREMMSALTSAIWSGSAYFSAVGFGILRHLNVDYVNIFLITAAMYTIGVGLYYLLILDYHKREKLGLI